MTTEVMASRAVWTAFEQQTGMEGLTKWAEQTGKIIADNEVNK
ncbi:MAG: hypothetical protein WCJ93_11755 [Methanomicrobiales archaeon]